ncbi:hypothetical protein ACFSLT_21345 [Novosphingobium resinovorum]
MDLPLIDRIWRVRGSLALEVRRTPRDAFARLDHLFRAVGTTFRIDGDTLAFSKKDPIAQDRMAIFNHGALWVEDDGQSAELRYDLNSPTLRLCFFLPFLFLGIAWLLKVAQSGLRLRWYLHGALRRWSDSGAVADPIGLPQEPCRRGVRCRNRAGLTRFTPSSRPEFPRPAAVREDRP